MLGGENIRVAQDMVFGFKSTNLFCIRDVPRSAARARQVKQHVVAELVLAAQGLQIPAGLLLNNSQGRTLATAHTQGLTQISPSLAKVC